MAFDVKTYAKLKESGVINKVEKTNEDTPEALTYAVYIKDFEIDGTQLVQLSDKVEAISEKELKTRETEIGAEKAAIAAFREDAV